MSDLERQTLKQRLGGLPPMPPPGVGGRGGGASKRAMMRKRDYTPVYWDKYFDMMHDVKVAENTFRVYECGTEGPVLLFLHGGGFSALSWSLLSSTLSNLITCRCAAIDLRGHGDTVTSNDRDLSAEVLSSDIASVVEELYGDEPPPIILIGHSMGGAIAVHVAEKPLIPSLVGLVVIDVVEGTALEALSSMQSYLRGRPKVFNSLEHAIEWCVRSGQVRNLDSAKVSMVGQVKRVDTDETASAELEHQHSIEDVTNNLPAQSTIVEEDEVEGQGQSSGLSSDMDTGGDSRVAETQSSLNAEKTTQDQNFKQPEPPPHSYTWRIDLGKTEQYWKGWFEGLSQRFLSCDVPKMLLLAGVDRLDRDLTIGQMQGKFQMQVLPKSGHAVHEDVPDQVPHPLVISTPPPIWWQKYWLHICFAIKWPRLQKTFKEYSLDADYNGGGQYYSETRF